jgi:predicted SnoaL-like aldol condensation-catalyzing enzyme
MIIKSKKEVAEKFLTLCAKGRSREAFDLFADKNFIHHNVYFKGDAETLMLAIEDDTKKNPKKIFEIKHSLEDGNLAAVHSHVRQNPKDLGAALVHIFRFENNKIIELWDFGQRVPENIINENGMF